MMVNAGCVLNSHTEDLSLLVGKLLPYLDSIRNVLDLYDLLQVCQQLLFEDIFLALMHSSTYLV